MFILDAVTVFKIIHTNPTRTFFYLHGVVRLKTYTVRLNC